MIPITQVNFEDVQEAEYATYAIRETARAVVFDRDGKIALMRVAKPGFYKLPGGGIDGGEDVISAVTRECREEAGVVIDMPQPLCMISEIKRVTATIQNSHCFITHILGEKQAPQFTESEKEQGFEVMWVALDDAFRLIRENGYTSDVGRYVFERELAILTEVQRAGS